MWYSHTMEYYLATKRSVVLTHATPWMNLENIMLSLEKPDTKHYIFYNLIYMKCSE